VSIVGAGLQGRRHLELILQMRAEVEEVRAYDVVPAATEDLLALAGDRRTVVAASAVEAVEGADLVVTCVTLPLGEDRLTAANASADALLLPVDYDDAMGPEAINPSTLYVVDDLGQYRSVAADHWHGLREPDGELAQVVAGELTVPTQGRRVFLNMGIAMDDVALGAHVYDRALEQGVGRRIAFP
jgi:ornithine cyclodeaminase/alanine dehydrogenase-like protein (mu-crystallin family)